MKLNYSEIEDLFKWVEDNKPRINQCSSFNELSKIISVELFKEKSPSEPFLKEIIFYLKSFSSKTKTKKCLACHGARGFVSLIGVKPGDKPFFNVCSYCNGSGIHLSLQPLR